MTDYERGRLAGRAAGYAEGVEAASEVAAGAGYEQTALRILALRAPSPVAETADYPCDLCGAMASVHPAAGCTGSVCVTPRAPPPKEDAATTLRRLGGTPPGPEAQRANLDANLAELGVDWSAPRVGRAPSPAEGAGPWFPPEVTAEEVAENRRWLGLPQQDADDAVDERIARSRAPSPKEDAPHGRCRCAERVVIPRGAEVVWVGTISHSRLYGCYERPVPSPAEDAPRCEACSSGVVVVRHGRSNCTCGGDGSSTAGGGR